MNQAIPHLLLSASLLAGLLAGGAAHAGGGGKADGGKDEAAVPTPEPYALVQVWGTLYDQDQDRTADPAGYGDPEDDPGFKLRRARVGFEGKGHGVRYGVILGMASAYDAIGGAGTERGELVDGYVGYKPLRGLWLTAGVQKIPVGREQLMSSSRLALAERSVSTEWMTPGRDAGLVADYRSSEDEDGSRLRLRLGAFNGDGSALGDDNAGKLFSGRVEFVHGPGNVYRTWGRVKKPTFGVAVDAWSNTDVNVATLGYGGDAMVRVGGLAVLLDARFATLKPVDEPAALPDVLATTPRQGGFVQVGYTVGAWEPAARFAIFDDDTGATDNGDVGEGTFGFTWHGRGDAVRAGGGYVLRLERGGASIPNDTARLWMQLRI